MTGLYGPARRTAMEMISAPATPPRLSSTPPNAARSGEKPDPASTDGIQFNRKKLEKMTLKAPSQRHSTALSRPSANCAGTDASSPLFASVDVWAADLTSDSGRPKNTAGIRSAAATPPPTKIACQP